MISGHESSHCCRVLTVGAVARSGATARSLKESFTGTGGALPDRTFRGSSVHGRRCVSGIAVTRLTGRWAGSTEGFWPKRTPPGRSIGRFRWTRLDHQPGPPARDEPSPLRRGTPNYKKLIAEPTNNAIGRSRGGLSTSIHHACDGEGRPLAMILGPGQGGDSAMFPVVMEAMRVPRLGGGRARTRRHLATPIRRHALVACSDLLSVHVPVTDPARHLIDVDVLRGMKREAILACTARGPIEHKAALRPSQPNRDAPLTCGRRHSPSIASATI